MMLQRQIIRIALVLFLIGYSQAFALGIVNWVEEALLNDGRVIEVESPRELRRLHYLREWSHEQDEQILPGSQRSRRTAGA